MRIQRTVCCEATLWPTRRMASVVSTSAYEPGWPSAPKVSMNARGRGRRAEPGVAVHVRRAQPRLADHGQRVVILDEELAGVVDPDRAGGEAVADLLATAATTRSIASSQRRLAEPAAAADQGAGEAVGAVVRLPAVQPLGPEPAAVDPVVGPAPDADDPAVLDADVQPAAVRAEHAGRLDPALGLLGRPLVDADRPVADVGRPLAPDVRDAVARRGHARLPRPGPVPIRDRVANRVPRRRRLARIMLRRRPHHKGTKTDTKETR